MSRKKTSAIGRSENMRRIRSKDTKPELIVRQLLRQLGYAGYRVHRRDLPGKPDVAFIGRRKSVLIHGCFWHGHNCKEGIRAPKSNTTYWLPKIERNRQRDLAHLKALDNLAWKILTIWECELRDTARLQTRLLTFMRSEIPNR
ncbi:MAG: DNA mismatch endonuclease Vsr [Proteobacteria bacterium]|nr:DNA mismatch endonuclease Vsr [Pseudomonadota bacterium]